MKNVMRWAVPGCLALLVASGLFAYLSLAPQTQHLANLRIQLQTVLQARQVKLWQSQAYQARRQALVKEVSHLSLFDLRNASNPLNAMSYRSDLSLIAMTQIFSEHHITLQALSPMDTPSEVATASGAARGQTAAPQFQRLTFRFKATGLYPDLTASFRALRKLPPTIQVDGYDVRYLGRDQAHARMEASLLVTLNFLTSAGQPVQQSAGAPGLPFGLGQMPAATLSLLPATEAHHSGWLHRLASLICPSAQAAELKVTHRDLSTPWAYELTQKPQGVLIHANARLPYKVLGWQGSNWILELPGVRATRTMFAIPQGKAHPISLVQLGQYHRGMARLVIHGRPRTPLWIVHGGHDLLVTWSRPRSEPSHVVMRFPAKHPQQKAARSPHKKAAQVAPVPRDPELPLGSNMLDSGVVYGRAEPFLPLVDASASADLIGTGDELEGDSSVSSLEGLLLRGIMLGEGRPVALIADGDQLLRLHPGSTLPGGQVQLMAIGIDYVLLHDSEGVHKLTLAHDSGSPAVNAASSSAAAPQLPGIPSLPTDLLH